MKRFYFLIFIFLLSTILFTGKIQAANYYLDTLRGNDKNSGGLNAPWETFSKANSFLKPGDTVFIRAGTYTSEQIAPFSSGQEGNYITYESYHKEKVIILGGKTQISLDNKDFVKIKGIVFRSPKYRWATILNSNNLIIVSCIFEGITTSMQYNPFYVDNCDYAQFIDSSWDGSNQIDDSQHDMAAFNRMSHSFWLRCNFGFATHDSFSAKKANPGDGFNVVMNCTFENPWRHGLVTGDPYQNWLIEGNTFKNGGSEVNSSPYPGDHGRISSTIKHDGKNFIIRNNTFYRNDIDLTFRSLSGGGVDGLWFYHNTSYNQKKASGNTIGGLAIYSEVENWVTNSHIINNIFWEFDGALKKSYDFQIYVKGDGIKRNRVEYNIFGRTGSVGHYRWDIDDNEIKASILNIQRTNSWANNLESNPLFVDTNKHDFKLKMGSPAIDAATNIALTKGGVESPSKTLVCNNVRWAFSGNYSPWFINHSDISADRIYFIQRDGTWAEREVRSIDYTKQTIKLDLPATWNDSTPIYYKKFKGSAPDIGAFESASRSTFLQPPKKLVVK